MVLLLILVVLVPLVGELGVNWSSRSSLWARVCSFIFCFFMLLFNLFFSGVHWTKSVGAQALKTVWILSSLYGRTLVVSTFSWH